MILSNNIVSDSFCNAYKPHNCHDVKMSSKGARLWLLGNLEELPHTRRRVGTSLCLWLVFGFKTYGSAEQLEGNP